MMMMIADADNVDVYWFSC